MLNEKQRELGRRNFLKAVATVPAAGALLWKTYRSRPVRAGIVGCGGQGGVLLENAPPSHMRIVAVCDIAPDNLERALKVARQRHDPEAQGYQDFNEMLARRDIEAVLVATPLWMHEPVTVAALNARKHVFCEKTMAHTAEECRRMIAASLARRRNLQIGHQRVANPLYHEAYNLIHGGVIGDVYHVRALWHRNTDWRRRVPESLDMDPRQYGYENLEHLKNWRLYDKYSQGLMAELGSHQLQVVNWFAGANPTSVYASGGVHRFTDGREAADHVYAIFEYPENLTLTYSTIQSNKYDHYYEQIMGTKGTIVLQGEREAMLFMEDGKEIEATKIDAGKAAASGPMMSASESRLRDAAGSAVGGTSSGYNPLAAYRDELAAFCSTIRYWTPNPCDGQAGLNACVPILLANQSMKERRKIDIGPEWYSATDV